MSATDLDRGLNTPESEECNIHDVVGNYYLFYQCLAELRVIADSARDIGDASRYALCNQLDLLEAQYHENHEWIITRDVQEIRLGVVGTPDSCKTSLIRAFHEGVVEIGDDEPNGRYKLKVHVGGKPCLLMIREETGQSSQHLSQWADILMMMFGYSSASSLNSLVEMYQQFREHRLDCSDMLIVLVGVVDNVLNKVVSESEVRRVANAIDNCRVQNCTLNQPSSVHNVFVDACKRYILSQQSYLHPSPTIPTSVPLTSSIPIPGSTGTVNSVKFHESPPQASALSPVIASKRSRRKSPLFPKQGNVAVQKHAGTPMGTGRHIPVKEGQVFKKSTGAIRNEWKKKYLVLSETELTYYPNIQDYMNQIHGKKFSLQQITVKVPGQHMPVARTPSNPPQNSVIGDPRGNSQGDIESSFTSSMESSLVRGNPAANGGDSDLVAVVVPPSPSRLPREPRSPVSEDGDSDHEPLRDDLRKPRRLLGEQSFFPIKKGHHRNSSMDEAYLLKQLRTRGNLYQPPEMTEERERSMTLLRAQIQAKVRLKKNSKRPKLGPIFHSEEDLSDSLKVESSQESLVKGDKKGRKDRNSMVISGEEGREVRRTPSKHRRQRSIGGKVDLGETHNETSVFNVHSLDGKVWTFDAQYAEEMLGWTKAIGLQIKKCLEDFVLPNKREGDEEYSKIILSVKGNDFCADCNSPSPEWASLNHGSLVCIACSGVHRNLGSHISRVRSIHLDEWRPELMAVMTSIGNDASRRIYEAKLTRNRPIHSASREEKERFIRAKYVDKEYLAELPDLKQPLSLELLDAVKSNDPVRCVHLLAHATQADVNYQHHDFNGGSALHVACNLGRVVLVQLLIWKLADVNQLDSHRHSPLYCARIAGHEDCAQILIQNNCNEDVGLHSPLSSESGSNEVLPHSVP